MAKENLFQPPDDAGADHDTDDGLREHPELAPDEGLQDPIRGRANVGDFEVEGEEDPSVRPLSFNRNDDFQGNEGSLSTEADFSRGSGWEGGKLWGEEAAGLRSGEKTPLEAAAPKGFAYSEEQVRNLKAIAKEQAAADRLAGKQPGGNETKEGYSGDLRDQGRDLGRRQQATAMQAFGRDVGSSGLPGLDFEADEAPKREPPKHKPDWSAVLGKLGGSSPGSQENLQLADIFSQVKFPSTRDEVLQKVPVGSEFKARSMTVGLHEAVMECNTAVFRSMNDLIDCVKDAIRRSEKLATHTA